MKNHSITVSAPGKIHLLGEHFVVYGKPALLAAVDLRVIVTITSCHSGKRVFERIQNPDSGVVAALLPRMTEVVEPIVKNHLKIKTIPPYHLEISSQIPINAGLGSSAAVSASYIAALLTFLKVDWDPKLINELTFEAEKVFHGTPSGGDNSTVVFGGFIWFRKESPDLKIIYPVPFTIPKKLAGNFVLINTGKPEETTRQMVELVKSKVKNQKSKFRKIFDDQERLVRELLPVLKDGNEKEFIRIINKGENNLESIGVVSSYAAGIIRKIENAGGAAKICGAGSTTGPTGIILAYHPDKSKVEKIAKSYKLPYFSTDLGVEGIRAE